MSDVLVTVAALGTPCSNFLIALRSAGVLFAIDRNCLAVVLVCALPLSQLNALLETAVRSVVCRLVSPIAEKDAFCVLPVSSEQMTERLEDMLKRMVWKRMASLSRTYL